MTSTTRITLTCAVALLVSTCCCRSKLFGDEDEQEEDFAELLSSSSKSVKTEGASGPFTGQKVKMEFYLMSKCPYGTKVQLAMVDVL